MEGKVLYNGERSSRIRIVIKEDQCEITHSIYMTESHDILEGEQNGTE